MHSLSTKRQSNTSEVGKIETVIIVGEGADEPTVNPAIDPWVHKPGKRISLKELETAVGPDGLPIFAPKADPVYTSSQLAALDLLSNRAEAYFGGWGRSLPFTPRYNSLLIAPTGCGKTRIARDLAKKMRAELFVVSISEWIVRGALNEKSTISALIRVLERSQKTVLLLDEVDKFTSQTDSAWTRSLAAEIWALLDRRFPPSGDPPAETGGDEKHEDLQNRLTNGLYIVGAGTFQDAWDRSESPRCGFNTDQPDAITDNGIMEAIVKSGQFSRELLSRFSPTPILLRYPTRAEIPDLLERMGLNRLASDVGVKIDLGTLSFKGCGMRVFEQLGAELLITKMRRQKQAHVDLLRKKIVSSSQARSVQNR